MTSRMHLLREIDVFLERTGMSATAFGRGAVKDGHLVADLRAGRDLTLTTVDRVKEFMARHSAPQQQEAA